MVDGTLLLDLPPASTPDGNEQFYTVQGGTDRRIALDAILASVGPNPLMCTLAFEDATEATNGTWTLAVQLGQAGTLDKLVGDIGTNGGSFSLSVMIAGTPVVGISAVTLNAGAQIFTATSDNTYVATDKLQLILSGKSGTPKGTNVSLYRTV